MSVFGMMKSMLVGAGITGLAAAAITAAMAQPAASIPDLSSGGIAWQTGNGGDYGQVPEVSADKHKVLQILVNLIRNAKYACDESGRDDKRLVMRASNGDDRVRIAVIDNGIGIPAENLTRIFAHGFTTRKDGHGFGLHSGALAAKELGGALRAHSDSVGRGATFTLELPLRPPKDPYA